MLVAGSDLSVSTRLLTICFIMQILWPKCDSNPKIQGYTEGLNFGKSQNFYSESVEDRSRCIVGRYR